MGIGFGVDDPVALQVLSIVGASTCGFMLLFALPGLIVGIGMLLRKAWARVLGIMISILALFSFPFGTIIGIYSLFVLFQDAATEYFKGRLFLYTEILAVSIHASLIWIAVNTWGLVGAGIGYFLYYVAYGVMVFAVVRRETKFGFSARNLRLMLLAVPSIGLVYISQIYLSRPWAITFGSLATIIYGLYMMSAFKGLLGIRDRIVGRVFERVGNFFRRGRRPRSRD